MTNIQSVLMRLNENHPINEIQQDVVDLIAEALTDMRANLGYWEKAHLAWAIAASGWNLRSTGRPPKAWLRLALVNLDKARVSPAERDESYIPKDESIDALSFRDLANELRGLGATVL